MKKIKKLLEELLVELEHEEVKDFIANPFGHLTFKRQESKAQHKGPEYQYKERIALYGTGHDTNLANQIIKRHAHKIWAILRNNIDGVRYMVSNSGEISCNVRITQKKEDEQWGDYDLKNYHKFEMSFYVTFGDGQTGFDLTVLPGCCGTIVSHNTRVVEILRRQGMATIFDDIKNDFAKLWGAGMLVCTVLEGNEAELSRLRKTGWMLSSKYVNPRTRNTVQQWHKAVR